MRMNVRVLASTSLTKLDFFTASRSRSATDADVTRLAIERANADDEDRSKIAFDEKLEQKVQIYCRFLPIKALFNSARRRKVARN